MKIKKSLFGAVSLSLFVLTACEKGIPNIDKTDYFKEYSFETKANNDQVYGITNGINNAANRLSWVYTKGETYNRTNLAESYEADEGKVKILEDKSNINHLIIETTSSNRKQSKSGGVTVKQSSDIETTQWDAGGGRMIEITKKTTNGSVEERTDTYTNLNGSDNKDRKMDYITSLLRTGMSNFSASYCYADKDGTFACLFSSVNKSVTAVDWGASTKEHIKETRSQTVSFFDKDYRLTKYYSYTEATTNRDASTGEWYDSVKLVSYTYSLLEYHYGSRESASISALNNKAGTKA